MPTLKEIQDLLTETQSSLDTEQSRVKELSDEKDATIVTLNQTILDLQAIIDNGGDPVALQAIFDGLTTLKNDLESTVE
jgi:hypothetical protein